MKKRNDQTYAIEHQRKFNPYYKVVKNLAELYSGGQKIKRVSNELECFADMKKVQPGSSLILMGKEIKEG